MKTFGSDMESPIYIGVAVLSTGIALTFVFLKLKKEKRLNMNLTVEEN